MQRVQIIDSHTGGEPTRVVVAGGPDLGRGALGERVARFREQHDRFRSAVVNEPRGSDVIVGALLCEPVDRSCAAGVIFFNNVGYLGMCGHGTIGLMVTLAHMGRIQPGEHRIETPVGVVSATLHKDGSVSVANVPSYRKEKGVTVEVANTQGKFDSSSESTLTSGKELNAPLTLPSPLVGRREMVAEGRVRGDVAWGGNWFFLVEQHPWALDLKNVEQLTEVTWRIRQAVNAQGFPEVDHVELFGPPKSKDADSRNFVLCPGKAYDRSPCGTGTSAKLACLAADGKLAEGEPWIQESILGSRFTGSYRWLDRANGIVIPTITGTAHVTAEATLLLDECDPFCWGIG